ncbi:hypothetical protein BDE36_2456 [Arcticibacter tournemirensis]|uniref:Uncharacterized protein n=1 Tax=Arcticibacter tournemirensis TaxID=699437 RepID=A0A5M9H4J9_9SPHI|nr:hypothetical protein [Arcticibacter tournemirensis]KAA8480094.1 hypothetical protein F1649_15870 [Arcticibacter tournemirensis]TQM50698.1 hypothetical protein BDE36_2456 [Arcticibacter tournemirensis]
MKKLFSFLFFFLLISVGVFAAFKVIGSSPEKSKGAATNYHYKIRSADITDLRTMSNWEVGTGGSDCGDGSDVPCVIAFTPGTSDPDFQTFLNNRNLSGLLAASQSQKESD